MQNQKTSWYLVTIMIVLAAASRFLPHWHNFTAVGAMGLLGGAYFSKKYLSFVVPIAALWISDLLLNNLVYAHFYDGFVWFGQGIFWIYLGFAAVVAIGIYLIKKVKFSNILLASILASLAFFLISNFGTWLSSLPPVYPKSPAGLIAAYTAGIPFFWNTLLANLVYSLLLLVFMRPLLQDWEWRLNHYDENLHENR